MKPFKAFCCFLLCLASACHPAFAGAARPSQRDISALVSGSSAYVHYRDGDLPAFLRDSDTVLDEYKNEKSPLIDEIKMWMLGLRITTLKRLGDFPAIPADYDRLAAVGPDLDNPVYLHTMIAAAIERAMAFSMTGQPEKEVESYRIAFNLYRRRPDLASERYVVEAMFDLIEANADNDRPEAGLTALIEVVDMFGGSKFPGTVRLIGSAALQVLPAAKSAGVFADVQNAERSRHLAEALDGVIASNRPSADPEILMAVENLIRARTVLDPFP